MYRDNAQSRSLLRDLSEVLELDGNTIGFRGNYPPTHVF